MNKIDDIKRYYSIIDIAKRLGFEIDRNNKAICPFHNDTNPNIRMAMITNTNFIFCIIPKAAPLFSRYLNSKTPLTKLIESIFFR